MKLLAVLLLLLFACVHEPFPVHLYARRIQAWQHAESRDPAQAKDWTHTRLGRSVLAYRAARPEPEPEALLRWVTDTVPYVPDPVGVDHFPTTRQMLYRGQDDCDGRQLVAMWLLRSYGYDAKRGLIAQGPRFERVHLVSVWHSSDEWVVAVQGLGPMFTRQRVYPESKLPGRWQLVSVFDEQHIYR